MLKYLQFCQCVILLASLERIVCPLVDGPINSFGFCDIYNKITIEGDSITSESGQFIFRKETNVGHAREFFIPFSYILLDTLDLESNNLKVISFFAKGSSGANFNIKFKTKDAAKDFVEQQILPPSHQILWGRVYSYWRPSVIAFEFLPNNDLGFRICSAEEIGGRYHERPYLFRRSEVDTAVRLLHPYNMYLRSVSRLEDYFIQFSDEVQKNTFVDLFPFLTYNEPKTFDYYFIR